MSSTHDVASVLSSTYDVDSILSRTYDVASVLSSSHDVTSVLSSTRDVTSVLSRTYDVPSVLSRTYNVAGVFLVLHKGVVQPDKLLMLSHHRELILLEVRQRALEDTNMSSHRAGATKQLTRQPQQQDSGHKITSFRYKPKSATIYV